MKKFAKIFIVLAIAIGSALSFCPPAFSYMVKYKEDFYKLYHLTGAV